MSHHLTLSGGDTYTGKVRMENNNLCTAWQSVRRDTYSTISMLIERADDEVLLFRI